MSKQLFFPALFAVIKAFFYEHLMLGVFLTWAHFHFSLNLFIEFLMGEIIMRATCLPKIPAVLSYRELFRQHRSHVSPPTPWTRFVNTTPRITYLKPIAFLFPINFTESNTNFISRLTFPSISWTNTHPNQDLHSSESFVFLLRTSLIKDTC